MPIISTKGPKKKKSKKTQAITEGIVEVMWKSLSCFHTDKRNKERTKIKHK